MYINKINVGLDYMLFNILRNTEYLVCWMCRS